VTTAAEHDMPQFSTRISLEPDFRRYARTTGWVLLVLGLAGILLPKLVSITLSVLIGWLLLLAGGISAYLVYYSYRRSGLAWLKPFVLFAIGLLVIFNPTVAIAAIGLLLAVYFLLDGFAGVTFAMELRPLSGSGWMLANGILSFLLAAVLLIGWPFSSLWVVGLLIGIRLFLDGLALLMLSASVSR
jgi:uncharacterized membrane protein HdeD (DUF308 family)